MTPIAVTVGDPAGIGPEIGVRAVAERDEPHVLIGDARDLAERLRAEGRETRLWAPGMALEGSVGLVDVGPLDDEVVQAHAPTLEGGRFQLAALDRGIDLALAGQVAALVTGPTSKEAITLTGRAFTGQTEHLAERAGLARDAVSMLFLGPRLRVGLVTTHLSVREATDAITPARVRRTAVHLGEALRALGFDPPRIVVCGLNPHAGEGGLFGDEEQRAIAPGIPADAIGPVPAEAALRLAVAGRYDGAVAMIHDQATIASKLVDWGDAVNVTWGLPFVRTSVDHGVAYDAAREGTADAAGMTAALALARRLIGRTSAT